MLQFCAQKLQVTCQSWRACWCDQERLLLPWDLVPVTGASEGMGEKLWLWTWQRSQAQRSSSVKPARAGEACFYFLLKEREKIHPAGWVVQPLATDLLDPALLLRPAVHSYQGRDLEVAKSRAAGGCSRKVCNRKAGGALVPVS